MLRLSRGMSHKNAAAGMPLGGAKGQASDILIAAKEIEKTRAELCAGQEAFTTYDKKNVLKQVHNIYNTVSRMLEESKATGKPEGVIATEFAENRINNGLDA